MLGVVLTPRMPRGSDKLKFHPGCIVVSQDNTDGLLLIQKVRFRELYLSNIPRTSDHEGNTIHPRG